MRATIIIIIITTRRPCLGIVFAPKSRNRAETTTGRPTVIIIINTS